MGDLRAPPGPLGHQGGIERFTKRFGLPILRDIIPEACILRESAFLVLGQAIVHGKAVVLGGEPIDAVPLDDELELPRAERIVGRRLGPREAVRDAA
jgi:hypothetical protein